jgi:hypothetical protein
MGEISTVWSSLSKRQREEEYAKKNYSDTESDNDGKDGFEAKESNKEKENPAAPAFRRLRHYQNDTSQFQALSLSLFKTIIKKVKRSKIVDKSVNHVFDALPWEGTEKKTEDPPCTIPCI